MSIAAIVTRGFASGGSIPLVVTRGYGSGEAPPVVEQSIIGGDDAWIEKYNAFRKKREASKPRPLNEELRELYEELSNKEKVALHEEVSEFAVSEKAARKSIIPAKQIDWLALAEQMNSVEALLLSYERRIADEEDIEFLLLSA